MKHVMNTGKYLSAFCLITACAETLCWAFTGRGYTQVILSTEDVSPFLVNPVVIFYWLLAGMWSHDLATSVREFVLAPIAWFSSRAVVQVLRAGAVVQGIVLTFILLHVFSTVREHGMDAVFSTFISLVGIPVGIVASAVWLRYAALNPIGVRTIGGLADKPDTPGIVTESTSGTASCGAAAESLEEQAI